MDTAMAPLLNISSLNLAPLLQVTCSQLTQKFDETSYRREDGNTDCLENSTIEKKILDDSKKPEDTKYRQNETKIGSTFATTGGEFRGCLDFDSYIALKKDYPNTVLMFRMFDVETVVLFKKIDFSCSSSHPFYKICPWLLKPLAKYENEPEKPWKERFNVTSHLCREKLHKIIEREKVLERRFGEKANWFQSPSITKSSLREKQLKATTTKLQEFFRGLNVLKLDNIHFWHTWESISIVIDKPRKDDKHGRALLMYEVSFGGLNTYSKHV